MKIEDAEIPGELTPAQKRLSMELAGFYAGIGMVVSSFNTYDGVLIISQSEQRATELVAAARHNKQVYKWVERLAHSNDMIAAIVGHGVMVYALMANHGRIEPNPVILHKFGMSKEQVLGLIPGLSEVGSNGAGSGHN